MHPTETKIYIVFLITFLACAVAIGMYIFAIIRNHKRELERKRNYMFNEITILEKERERIAHNIHDTFGPELSMLKFSLDDLKLTDEPGRQAIVELKLRIDQLIADARLLSHNLMPNSLSKYGFVYAVDELCSKMTKKNLIIQFDCNDEIEIPANIAVHLYRIIEEVIYNTIKHAEASTLKISMSKMIGSFIIIARDNGKGFDQQKEISTGTGLGISGFLYRTELMGGNFSIHSEIGKGVEIKIELPINRVYEIVA